VPDELLGRTATLVRRGGLAGALTFLVFSAGDLVLVGPGVFAITTETRLHVALTVVLFLLGLVGIYLLPVASHAAFLAGFACAIRGRAEVGATLRRALREATTIAKYGLIELGLTTPLVFGGGATIALGMEDQDVVNRILLASLGLVTISGAAWIHGFMLIGCAHLALEGSWDAQMRPGESHGAAIAGAVPLLACFALIGGSLAHDSGLRTSPLALHGSTAVVVTVVGVFLAHVVSCAVAVAVASRPGEAT
jgi:hypothetical protein